DVPGRGQTFVYEMEGPPDAPVLFLIHGLVASTQLNWFPAFPVLADRYRVVATDLRGHGRGFPVGSRFRLADCADDMAAVADVLVTRWAMEELRRVSPTVALQAMSTMGRFSSHEWIADIDVPTAVVVTTKDRFIAPTRQIKLANAIPGATVHPVHAGHAACVLSYRRFVPALVEACESVVSKLPGRGDDARDRLGS